MRSVACLLDRLIRTRRTDAADRDVCDLDAPEVVESLRRHRSTYFVGVDLKSHAPKPWKSWSVAVLATAIAHAVFVGSLAYGSRGKSLRQPNSEGFSATSQRGDGKEVVSILFFVNDKTIHVKQEGDASPYSSEASASVRSESQLLSSIESGKSGSPPSLEIADAAAEESAEAFGDGAKATELYGIYMGQIKARIERVWEVPNSVQHRAQCKVQIRQSRDGSVEDVTVQRCDLNLQDQMSLVRAIQSASPLSAPPIETLFTELVTLVFVAEPHHKLSNNTVERSTARVAQVQIR